MSVSTILLSFWNNKFILRFLCDLETPKRTRNDECLARVKAFDNRYVSSNTSKTKFRRMAVVGQTRASLLAFVAGGFVPRAKVKFWRRRRHKQRKPPQRA